ncbi:hypothetical protein QJS04_geneDACA011443 [Acorus gramineus]|uniref:Uncharacterized protein n=1 Tax=Acorus gramineus TaxID=55184 RepID=A0AAV9ALA3_ACOGR|nr:hypothetical protein QJS04_geneDACA011443 [Acorus gramineus]
MINSTTTVKPGEQKGPPKKIRRFWRARAPKPSHVPDQHQPSDPNLPKPHPTALHSPPTQTKTIKIRPTPSKTHPKKQKMASLSIAFGAAAVTGPRVYAATAAAKSGGGGEEKGVLDWILGGLQKEDQMLETDPILKKVEEKSGTGGRGGGSRKTSSVSVPAKKKNGGGGFGGLGGLFEKK